MDKIEFLANLMLYAKVNNKSSKWVNALFHSKFNCWALFEERVSALSQYKTMLFSGVAVNDCVSGFILQSLIKYKKDKEKEKELTVESFTKQLPVYATQEFIAKKFLEYADKRKKFTRREFVDYLIAIGCFEPESTLKSRLCVTLGKGGRLENLESNGIEFERVDGVYYYSKISKVNKQDEEVIEKIIEATNKDEEMIDAEYQKAQEVAQKINEAKTLSELNGVVSDITKDALKVFATPSQSIIDELFKSKVYKDADGNLFAHVPSLGMVDIAAEFMGQIKSFN